MSRRTKPNPVNYEIKMRGKLDQSQDTDFDDLQVTALPTIQSFAWCMQDLGEIHYPAAEKIRGVDNHCANDGNHNTHSQAGYYAAFSPQRARCLAQKLEYHFAPKPSSWMNMAEVEIGVPTEQWFDRR